MKFWTLTVTALMVALTGCGGNVENQDRIDAILALEGDPVAGKTAFETSTCVDCHGADATGGTGPSLVGNDDTESMAAQILNGGETMPPFASLSDQTIADILSWTQSL